MCNQASQTLPPPKSECATLFCLVISWALIIIAVLAPFVSILIGDSPSGMFQRGGAVTTIASMLTVFLEKWALARHYSGMGFIALEEKPAFIKYQQRFKPISTTSFCLSIIGTAIWGYGDLLLESFVARLHLMSSLY